MNNISFWFSLPSVSIGVGETIEPFKEDKTIVDRYILLVKRIGVLDSMSI